MTWLITRAIWTLCWITTGLDYQPQNRPEKNILRLEKTLEIAYKKLIWTDTEITETVFDWNYAWAYWIKFSWDYYQDTFFIAVDPKTMSYVRIRKNSLVCKK